jgi:hypothetical protein
MRQGVATMEISTPATRNDAGMDKSLIELSTEIQKLSSYKLTAAEESALELYDQLDELRLEKALLEAARDAVEGTKHP